jgi:tetratricopeptide (TPR) repeat protein
MGKWLKRISIVGGIVLLFISGFLYLRPFLFESQPKSVAVISFENQTGDESYNPLQTVIPNLLITSLEQSKALCVNTWERMYDLLKQRGSGDVRFIDKNLGFDLCKMDNIETVIIGEFFKAGDMIVISLNLLDVKTGKTLKNIHSEDEGIVSIIRSQIDRLSREIFRTVGISDREIEMLQPIADVTTTSIEAYNYFVTGIEDVFRFYPIEARQSLEKAIQLDSTFAMAYLYLANVYDLLEDSKARNDACKIAKVLAQKATERERLYIDAYYAQFIEKDPEKKFRFLKELIQKYPKEKRAHFYLAHHYNSKGLFSEAIEEFNRAVKLDPNYGLALNDLAYTYSYIGDFEKAIVYIKKYASICPEDANVFDSMGEIYLKMGRLDDAIEKYKEALEIMPDFGSDWVIAYIYALKEDYSEAMKWIDQFIHMAPSPDIKAEGYLWKGFYRYWIGCLDRSLGEIQKAVTLAAASENKLLLAYSDWMKGWMYYDRRQYELGRKHYKNGFDFILKEEPVYAAYYTANSHFYLGLVHLKEGRIASAKSNVSEIKSLLPAIDPFHKDWTTSYYNILHAEVLFAEDSLQQAIVVCEDGVTLEMPDIYPTRDMLHYNLQPLRKDILARIYQQSGELDRAIAEYERLITFDSKRKERWLIFPVYHYNLAKLYEEKRRSEVAIEQYEKFLHIWSEADDDLPELADARVRLAKLTGGSQIIE